MKTKEFDCVELQHEGARRIYEETKDFTLEQEVEYWRRKSEEMMHRHEQIKWRKGNGKF